MKRTLSIEANQKIGKDVQLAGWVQTRRDLGKLIFIDFRDREGLVQVIFVPGEASEASYKLAKGIRPEFVIEVAGLVQERNQKNINPDLPTGRIEILAKELKILSRAKTPPFEVDKDSKEVNEEIRLKYRYIDLRTERMAKNLKIRHKVLSFIRKFFEDNDFLEVQTPILTKSTPEGARDFIVPSRRHAGKFYALPQSPQQYKQLLMIAGMERYFQIAPCMRDEDARADRSPGEFYQLDMEMSFASQDEIMEIIEKLMVDLVGNVFPDKKLTFEKFPRLSWSECQKKYKADKPDLRQNKKNPHELAFCWVIDWPLFEPEKEDGHFAPAHHMFTRPRDEDLPMLDQDPAKARSYQMDLVLNGCEVGGGSLRIHDAQVQEKIFDLIGFDAKQKKYFSHILEALDYGAPPHGGIAPGIERLLAILLAEENIREVVAFPKSGDARDLTVGAPSEIGVDQLKEAHISVKKEK